MPLPEEPSSAALTACLVSTVEFTGHTELDGGSHWMNDVLYTLVYATSQEETLLNLQLQLAEVVAWAASDAARGSWGVSLRRVWEERVQSLRSMAATHMDPSFNKQCYPTDVNLHPGVFVELGSGTQLLFPFMYVLEVAAHIKDRLLELRAIRALEQRLV